MGVSSPGKLLADLRDMPQDPNHPVTSITGFSPQGVVGHAVPHRSAFIVRIKGRRKPFRERSVRACLTVLGRYGASNFRIDGIVTGGRGVIAKLDAQLRHHP